MGVMPCSEANLLRHIYLQMALLRPGARLLMRTLPFGCFFLHALMTTTEHLRLVYLHELAVKALLHISIAAWDGSHSTSRNPSCFPHRIQEDSGNDAAANDGCEIHGSSHVQPYLACKPWQITNTSPSLYLVWARDGLSALRAL